MLKAVNQSDASSRANLLSRKVMLVKYATAYVVMPGVFGKLDEFAEIQHLLQTGKTRNIPIILVGCHFLDGLLLWGLLLWFETTPDPCRHHRSGQSEVNASER